MGQRHRSRGLQQGPIEVWPLDSFGVASVRSQWRRRIVLALAGLIVVAAVVVTYERHIQAAPPGRDRQAAEPTSHQSANPCKRWCHSLACPAPEPWPRKRAGNIYVADTGNNRVVKLAPESAAQQVIGFTDLNRPVDVAVDSAGNVYVVDHDDRLVQWVAGRNTQRVLAFPHRESPAAVAVDSAGNVYVTDNFFRRVVVLVVVLPVGATTHRVVPLSGVDGPGGLAVDSAGNLYVADTGNNRVVKLTAG
jgi:NHL repeat